MSRKQNIFLSLVLTPLLYANDVDPAQIRELSPEAANRPVFALATNADLYYETHTVSGADQKIEIRPMLGYEFSHPYLQIYSGNLGVLYRLNPILALGVEGSLYGYANRDSLNLLERELGDYGFHLNNPRPLWGAVSVFRITPFSSLTNLFSRSVLVTDMSVSLRAGFTKYGVDVVPLGGFLFDVNFELSKQVALLVGMNWDMEKFSGQHIQSRVGVRFGPVVKF